MGDPLELEVCKVFRLGNDLRVVVSPDLLQISDAFRLLEDEPVNLRVQTWWSMCFFARFLSLES